MKRARPSGKRAAVLVTLYQVHVGDEVVLGFRNADSPVDNVVREGEVRYAAIVLAQLGVPSPARPAFEWPYRDSADYVARILGGEVAEVQEYR